MMAIEHMVAAQRIALEQYRLDARIAGLTDEEAAAILAGEMTVAAQRADRTGSQALDRARARCLQQALAKPKPA